MTIKTIAGLAAGGAALIALSLPFTLTISQAQGNDQGGFGRGQGQGQGFPPGQGNPPQGFGQGQPGQPGFQRPGGGGGMGGGAAMVEDANFLYVLQGNRLVKIQKSNLQVVGQGMIGMPDRPGEIGAPPPGGAGPKPPSQAK